MVLVIRYMNYLLHCPVRPHNVAAMGSIRDVTELTAVASRRFNDLSSQLKLAARYILDHPEDVALRSMRELSQAARLPPVTFVRLARTLGLSGYTELRNLYQRKMRESAGSARYSLKARNLQLRRHGAGTIGLLKDLFSAEMENIEQTFEKNDPDDLINAVKLIEGAQRICVLGQRSCYPTSYFFHYVYGLFRSNSVLLQSHGGTVIDELRSIGPRDLLLVVSMAPYAADAIRGVQFVREQGARILAVTDGPLSPVACVADQTLLIATGTPSFFHSIVSAQALLQSLLALLVARGGAEALAAIKVSERQLARFNVYWSGEGQRRKRR